jgi:hypothetical protein
MLAWPPAVALATCVPTAPVYRVVTVSGDQVDIATADTVRAELVFPMQERGVADRLIASQRIAEAEARRGTFLRQLTQQHLQIQIMRCQRASFLQLH